MRRVRCPLPPLCSLLAVLAVAAVALPACGDAGREAPVADRASDPDALPHALEATRAVSSGRVEVTTTLTGIDGQPGAPPGRDSIVVAVHRATFDLPSRRVAVETDMSEVAEVIGPEASMPGDLSVPARMIAAGDVVYSQGGPFWAALAQAPDEWVQLDRARLVANGPESDTAALVLQPLAPFGLAAEAQGDVRVVGEERLRGVPVTHLVAQVRADAGGVGGGVGDAGDAAPGPLDVWIDADGVIRRLEHRLGRQSGGGGLTSVGEVVTTVELLDVGEAVEITPPAEPAQTQAEPAR
jgi:hypothetical protein